jgi:hypothetical protein
MKMTVDAAVTVPVNVCALTDDTDFKSREESVAYNASGLDLTWNFVTPAGVQTQTAVTPTNTGGSYDWVNVGNGMYNIEIPASGGGSINNDTEGYGWFNGVATGVLPWVGPVIEFVPANVVNSLVTGIDKLQVDSVEIGSNALSTDGPIPHLGIADQGTAQSASSTGLVLRSAAAFADDVLIGCTLAVYGSTQGYWQFRQITDNALSGDTVTVDAWTVTPSGTITYKIFGGAPASATLPPAVNVEQWKGATAPAMTGDAFARLGAPAGASVSADLLVIDNLVDDLESRIGTPSNLGGGATIAANLSDIEAQTDDIGAAGAGLTALASAANLATVAGYLDTEIAAILADTNELQTDWANGGRLDLILDARASQTSVDAVQTKTDQLTFTGGNKVHADLQALFGATTISAEDRAPGLT